MQQFRFLWYAVSVGHGRIKRAVTASVERIHWSMCVHGVGGCLHETVAVQVGNVWETLMFQLDCKLI